MTRYWLPALIVATALGAAPAVRANLVQNPGFELDDTSGGPVSPPSDWGAMGDAGADSTLPHSGTNDAFIGVGGLSQSLATATGTAYTISFYLAADQTTITDGSSTFDATFDGLDLLGGTPITGADFALPDQYAAFSYQATASGSSAVLAFVGFTTSDAGTWYLDDVSVAPTTTVIPEPPAVLILLTMAIGLGATCYRWRCGW